MKQKQRKAFVPLVLLTVLLATAWNALSENTGNVQARVSSSGQEVSAVASQNKQDSSDRRVAWLKNQVVPIQSQEMGSGFTDLERFGNVFDNKRIVGLGEATHGTQDFDKLRNRIVEYLVSQKGYRFITIEAEIGDSVAVEQYITQGTGTAQQALLPFVAAWTGQDYVKLLQWLRSWNQQHPDDMVHFYGCDAQRWKGVIDALEPQLPKTSAVGSILADIRHDGEEFEKLITINGPYYKQPGIDEATVQATVNSLKAHMRNAVKQLDSLMPSNGQARDVRFSRLLYENLRAYIDAIDPISFYYITTKQWAKYGKHFTDYIKQGDIRENRLASNMLAIADLQGVNSKGIYWAHDQHVGRGYVFAGNHSSGQIIADKLGASYFVVGTDFYAGQFRAFDQEKQTFKDFTKSGLLKSSLSTKLNQLGDDQLWLNLHDRSSNKPDEIWLFDPLKHYYAGGSYSDNEAQLSQLGGEFTTDILPDKFDAILFVRHTTAEQEDPDITKLRNA